MERLQVLGIFTSLSGQLGVEAVLFLLHQLLIALIDRKKLFVSRQWNILFHQDILNSPDIHTTQAGALRKRHRRGYAGGLASANALGIRFSQSMATSSAEICLPGHSKPSTFCGTMAR